MKIDNGFQPFAHQQEATNSSQKVEIDRKSAQNLSRIMVSQWLLHDILTSDINDCINGWKYLIKL